MQELFTLHALVRLGSIQLRFRPDSELCEALVLAGVRFTGKRRDPQPQIRLVKVSSPK